MILKSNCNSSIAMMCLRAKFCKAAVKKAYGKKNPEIQKETGLPFSTQLLKKSVLSVRSCCHEARGLSERKPFGAPQSVGT